MTWESRLLIARRGSRSLVVVKQCRDAYACFHSSSARLCHGCVEAHRPSTASYTMRLMRHAVPCLSVSMRLLVKWPVNYSSPHSTLTLSPGRKSGGGGAAGWPVFAPMPLPVLGVVALANSQSWWVARLRPPPVLGSVARSEYDAAPWGRGRAITLSVALSGAPSEKCPLGRGT